MEKTVVMTCAFLFISSLLVVDAMVRVPGFKLKVFWNWVIPLPVLPNLVRNKKRCNCSFSFFKGFKSLFSRHVILMKTLKTSQDLLRPTPPSE